MKASEEFMWHLENWKEAGDGFKLEAKYRLWQHTHQSGLGQKRLAWPLHKDDMQIRDVFHTVTVTT